nr:nucleoside-diphosphate kinase [Lacticaseibacillus nasuensis]
MNEHTLIIIKPDGLQRHLVGKILQYFEDANLNIDQCYIDTMTDDVLRAHYSQVVDKPFFPELKTYMQSGPCFFLPSSAAKTRWPGCGPSKATPTP